MIVRSEPQDSELKSIVLRLRGLHTEMSFPCCIGHIMAGSGLQKVLELVYAKNVVGHMLTSKAVARAVRGHFLVDAAQNTLVVCNTFNIPLPVDTRVYDAVQMTEEPTGTEEQQKIPTEPDEPNGAEEQQENAIEPDDPAEEQQENTTKPDKPTSTEEQQENATEPRPTDMDLELA